MHTSIKGERWRAGGRKEKGRRKVKGGRKEKKPSRRHRNEKGGSKGGGTRETKRCAHETYNIYKPCLSFGLLIITQTTNTDKDDIYSNT